MSKDVYIIGTGGFAAELTEYIEQNNKFTKEEINILGYFDINEKNYIAYKYKAPFLGNEKEFTFSKNDNVLIAIGEEKLRKKLITFFTNCGANIEGFIHHTAIISKNNNFGTGNIICPYVIIGPKTKIGNNNLINYYSTIAHDCEVGNNNIFSPNVHITGYCKIHDNNFFGTSSGMKPNFEVGSNNKIQAGIVIDRKLENNLILFSIQKIKTIKNLTK